MESLQSIFVHGVSKRRTWRKLHIVIDVNTQEIISVCLTGNDEDDAAVAQKMVEGKTEKIKRMRVIEFWFY